MLINDILQRKGGIVISIDADASVAQAASIMAREEIGALIVADADHRLLGILSEREIVASVAQNGTLALSATVGNIMITHTPVAAPNDRIEEIQRTMTVGRARHMPVVANGHVVGVVSLGDIVESRLQEKTYENIVLQDLARAHVLAA
ncbi:CBS domain-containing protein [Sphingobium sp. EM0848]|uniref:CBS domain-containing protein n=1 Tax=Sphingobium sp. EM0848 TaxID=2743473 RepID=UPI00159C789C|nr:CBS domain-containing protein [Sphingobium sp. EM0848]